MGVQRMGMKGGSAAYGERGMRGWECSVWV